MRWTSLQLTVDWLRAIPKPLGVVFQMRPADRGLEVSLGLCAIDIAGIFLTSPCRSRLRQHIWVFSHLHRTFHFFLVAICVAAACKDAQSFLPLHRLFI